MSLSTLAQIQQKVRRLTRSPSVNQLSDDDLNLYINTFVTQDFPSHLKLFSLHTNFTFYTNPYQDVYDTNTTNPTDPLYNFKNLYQAVNPPVYAAGYSIEYKQSQQVFFNEFPKINAISSIGPSGDGTTTSFSGVIATIPILVNEVLFSSVDSNNQGLALKDIPNFPFDGTGILVVPNTLTSQGTINYVTGAFTINFPTAPGEGIAINSQTVPYQPSLPQCMLYYNDKFTLRPVPDQPYRIQIEVDRNPIDLLNSTDTPELNQWWQYIAYGAAKKVFEDKLDIESVALIAPEFKKQELLVLRRTINQLRTQRSPTIYTEQTDVGSGYNNGLGLGSGVV